MRTQNGLPLSPEARRRGERCEYRLVVTLSGTDDPPLEGDIEDAVMEGLDAQGFNAWEVIAHER